MSVRSFTVFQDSPPVLHQPHDDTDVRAITLTATDAAAALLSTLAAIEKENLHPITGQRAGPTTASESKKRKTSALATKVLVVPASKKYKELDGEPNKTRKPLASTGKPRNSHPKKASSRLSRSSRKPSPLPPLVEEHVLQRQPPRLSISQIDIDARCFELTVSPLADVSEAYGASRLKRQEPDLQREKSAEPAIHDCFSPSPADKPHPATNNPSCNIDEPPRQVNDFSTLERERSYSAFTFSSPSPTSDRFKQAQSSPPRRASPPSDLEC